MNQVESSKLKPALIGGAAAGVASAIPILGCLNCACCALIMGGGFLAAQQYFKDKPASPQPPYGDAAILGILAGVFGAIVNTVLGIPMQLLSGAMGFNNTEKLREALDKADLPPQAEQWITTFASGGLSVSKILFTLAVSLVLYTIFGMIGALIGASVFNKKGLPPAPPAYMPPPPSPPSGDAV